MLERSSNPLILESSKGGFNIFGLWFNNRSKVTLPQIWMPMRLPQKRILHKRKRGLNDKNSLAQTMSQWDVALFFYISVTQTRNEMFNCREDVKWGDRLINQMEIQLSRKCNASARPMKSEESLDIDSRRGWHNAFLLPRSRLLWVNARWISLSSVAFLTVSVKWNFMLINAKRMLSVAFFMWNCERDCALTIIGLRLCDD